MIISRAICFQGIHADLFKLSQFLNFFEIFALFEFFSALVFKEPPLRVKFGLLYSLVLVSQIFETILFVWLALFN